ncbi:MAG: hypothetical protein MJ252_23120, partial [archaeon]|nr:hypothetical protein [archaeon]
PKPNGNLVPINPEKKGEEGLNDLLCEYLKFEPEKYFKYEEPKHLNNIFEIVLNIFETCTSSILIRNIKRMETNLEIDDNLLVIYNACVDFLIESLSTPNEDVIQFVQDKLSESMSNFCRYDLGSYGCLIFPPSKLILKDIYFKSRLFDLLLLVFTSPNCTYFEKTGQPDRINKTTDKLYFELLTTYIQLFLENYCKKEEQGKFKYIYYPQDGIFKNYDWLDKKIYSMNEAYNDFFIKTDDDFKEDELKKIKEEKNSPAFHLLEKIFTFIVVLKDKYGCNSFEEVVQLGRKKGDKNEKGKKNKKEEEKKKKAEKVICYQRKKQMNLTSEGKLSIYDYFKKRACFIEFNYKLSDQLKKNLTEEGYKDDFYEKEGQVIRKIYFYSNIVYEKKYFLLKNFFKTARIDNHRSKVNHLLQQVNEFAISHFFKKVFREIWDIENMKFFNIIHFLIILVINILLCAAYYKSIDVDEEDYYQSSLDDGRNGKWSWRFIVQFVSSIVLFIYHVFMWIIYFGNFFGNYIVKELEEKSKKGLLVPKEKEIITVQSDLLEGDYSKDNEGLKLDPEKIDAHIGLFNFIRKYYPKIAEENKLGWLITKITLKFMFVEFDFNMIFLCFVLNILFFILLVCDIYVPFLLSVPMISVFPLLQGTVVLFTGLKNQIKLLSLTLFSNWVVLYILMWVSFEWLPDLLHQDSVNFKGEEFMEAEPYCSGAIQCLFVFFGQGLYDGGIPELLDESISYKRSIQVYIAIFIYRLVGFLLINTVLANVFTSLITNTFDEQKQESDKRENDRENVCFICDYKSTQADIEGVDFEAHRHSHSILKYISFLIYLYTKEKRDHSLYERIIYDSINKKNISWLPYRGDDGENEEEDDDKNNKNNYLILI